MTIRVFIHKALRESFDPEQLAIIKQRFVAYKQDNVRHVTFGRDEQYIRPQSVRDSNLWHIHLKDITSKGWERRSLDIFYMTSNTALIYTRGERSPDNYLIISIIENAHSYYGGTEQYVRRMAEIARDFQKYY